MGDLKEKEMEPHGRGDNSLELVRLQPGMVVKMTGGSGYLGILCDETLDFFLHISLDKVILRIVSTSSDAILCGVPVRGVIIASVVDYRRGSFRIVDELVLISLWSGGQARRLKAVEMILGS